MGQRKYHFLWGRKLLLALLLIFQIIFLIYFIISSSRRSEWISGGLTALSVLAALYVVNRREKDAYKLTWVFLILLFPIFGGLFYLLFSAQTSAKMLAKKQKAIELQSRKLFLLTGDRFAEAAAEAPESIPQIRYLQHFEGFPVYRHTGTTYLTPGERKFEYLVRELEKAEHYIFLEYFIIREGVLWNTVEEVLARKAKEGVLVRVLYDDLGCFFSLPPEFPGKLAALGIQCRAFNPFRPFLTTKQNNRDHRKIAVIDGKTAFTGGINLADEYINTYEKYGHWKDAAIMIEGEAAWSFTLMFLEMWELTSAKSTSAKSTSGKPTSGEPTSQKPEEYEEFYPWKEEACPVHSCGLVQPYADSPMDRENVGEHVYLQIINNAKQYVYINTPYLIVDNSMLSALRLAAKSGIDVRIVTPHKWDKRLVHIATRSCYRDLILAGVKIYEYSLGFIHSKTFVSDDTVATVGTTNLDFRSLYLHFECGVWMYGTAAVAEIKNDFLLTLENCQRITEDDCRSTFAGRIVQDVLRLFGPRM
ncbi:MAG: cardiolipin synthase [Spirochaetaceae bacterium]|nr:cardiolipin synthase [Spirochaetaceae bacterium]